MDLLVLDTIHGGTALAGYFREMGHRVETVDVYRGPPGSASACCGRHFDLVVSPVHLDPAYILLDRPPGPVISHHDAVRRILSSRVPSPMIEITGTRGKTTAAFALAHLLPGPGILHTSAGTFREPGHHLLWKKSITPASLVPAAGEAVRVGGWLVAEVSLGLTGSGDLGIITSPEDYRCAAGKKSALSLKVQSAGNCRKVVLAPGISADLPGAVSAGDVAVCSGERMEYRYGGISGSYTNPLLNLDGYRLPLLCATAAACLLSLDPAPLGSFGPVPGRLAVSREGSRVIVDDSNSGVCGRTAVEAARYARRISGSDAVELVIGQEGRAVCEGFPPEEIGAAVREIGPRSVVFVGTVECPCPEDIPVGRAQTLAEGRDRAMRFGGGSVVLAVKTWR